jgi:hypothetical protein
MAEVTLEGSIPRVIFEEDAGNGSPVIKMPD